MDMSRRDALYAAVTLLLPVLLRILENDWTAVREDRIEWPQVRNGRGGCALVLCCFLQRCVNRANQFFRS